VTACPIKREPMLSKPGIQHFKARWLRDAPTSLAFLRRNYFFILAHPVYKI